MKTIAVLVISGWSRRTIQHFHDLEKSGIELTVISDHAHPLPGVTDKVFSAKIPPGFMTLSDDGSVYPGCIDFYTLDWIHHENPDFDYLWFIEYDVEYTGDWKTFFEETEKIQSDFLVPHILDMNPSWWWYGKGSTDIHLGMRAFCPIRRFSKRALLALNEYYSSHQTSKPPHFETLEPSLFDSLGMIVSEIPSDYIGYIGFPTIPSSIVLEPGKLYHPLK